MAVHAWKSISRIIRNGTKRFLMGFKRSKVLPSSNWGEKPRHFGKHACLFPEKKIAAQILGSSDSVHFLLPRWQMDGFWHAHKNMQKSRNTQPAGPKGWSGFTVFSVKMFGLLGLMCFLMRFSDVSRHDHHRGLLSHPLWNSCRGCSPVTDTFPWRPDRTTGMWRSRNMYVLTAGWDLVGCLVRDSPVGQVKAFLPSLLSFSWK